MEAVSGFTVTKVATPRTDLKTLCRDPQANPILIAQALDDATSKMWRDWEPETIRDLVGLPESAVQQSDKIMAVQVALTNADVFDDWHLFHHVATAFNHRRASFNWLDMLSYIEAAWAAYVLRALNTGQIFGPGVLRYLTAISAHDGLVFFPWIGGDGLNVCQSGKGWIDSGLQPLAEKVMKHWHDGGLRNLSSSEVDDKDLLEVQLAKIVNAQEYIRKQG